MSGLDYLAPLRLPSQDFRQAGLPLQSEHPMEPSPPKVPIHQQNLFVGGKGQRESKVGRGGRLSISGSRAGHQDHAVFLFGLPPDKTETGPDIAKTFGIDMTRILGGQQGKPAIGIGRLLGDLSVNGLGEMLAKLHHGGDLVIESIQQKEQPPRKDQSHSQAKEQRTDKSGFDGESRSGAFQNIDIKLADILADIDILNRPQKPVIKLLLSIPLGFHFFVFGHFSSHIQRLGLGLGHQLLQIGHLELDGLPLLGHRFLALLADNFQFSLIPRDFIL